MSRAKRALASAEYGFLLLSLSLACESGARRKQPASSATVTAPARAEQTPAAPAERTPEPPAPEPAPSATGSAPSVAEPAPSAAEPRAPLAAPCRVALIGDSLTDFAAAGGGFVRYLERRVPNIRFSNFAKGGAMVNQMRRRFEATVLTEPTGTFTHLLVFGGVNDLYSDETAGRTPAKIEADLSYLYESAKERGLRVVAIDVAPWAGFTKYDNPRRRAATLELNRWILEQVNLGKVDVAVDAYALLSCGDPVRLCPSYEPPHHDGLHFGKAGHEILGAALYDAEFRRCP